LLVDLSKSEVLRVETKEMIPSAALGAREEETKI